MKLNSVSNQGGGLKGSVTHRSKARPQCSLINGHSMTVHPLQIYKHVRDFLHRNIVIMVVDDFYIHLPSSFPFDGTIAQHRGERTIAFPIGS